MIKYQVVNLDALTYAASPGSLRDIKDNKDYIFREGKIQDSQLVRSILEQFKPQAVINFAAETHVDRSIDSPHQFIESNVVGAFNLLSESKLYFSSLLPAERENFRFLHISTDEIFGSCKEEPFKESAPCNPSSPYAASKAAADLIIKSYYHTYNFPIIITNCTNNYGPNQFPEKLIPHMIIKGIHNESLPLYGNGMQIRDWLYVEDHADAILKVLEKGKPGNTYNIAGLNGEISNKDVVEEICEVLNISRPRKDNKRYQELIVHVTDRPGHDFRYALDIEKIQLELEWFPQTSFKEGIRKTIQWYLDNQWWWQEILDEGYEPNRIGLKS